MPKRKAHLLLLPFCAFDEGFQVALGSAKWQVVRNESYHVKGKSVGHYGSHNPPATPPGGSKLISSGGTIFLADEQYPSRDANF
jgi:hypothetical protein